MKTAREQELEAALAPLARIADMYDDGKLNFVNPELSRKGESGQGPQVIIAYGITLGQVMQAREVLQGIPSSIPPVDPDIAKAKRVYEGLYMSGRTWDELRGIDRDDYVKRVKELGL